MDLWQLIARDHQSITQLIHEMPYALNAPGLARSRKRLLADLMDELESHAAALDAGLYAPLCREARTRQLVEELRREHQALMQQLSSLIQYGGRSSAGWLDRFEDATNLVDRHLYRQSHELFPAARELLSPEEARNATRVFVSAKMRALQIRQRGTTARLASSELALTATIGAAAVGLGLVIWRMGLLRGRGARRRRPGDPAESSRGQARGALAVPSALGNHPTSNGEVRRKNENPYSAIFRRLAQQDQASLSGSGVAPAIGETEAIYRVNPASNALREVVLPALAEANEALAVHGYQIYLTDQTLAETRDRPFDRPKILFRVARATLPEDLVSQKAHLFVFESVDAGGGVRFSVRGPGSVAHHAGQTGSIQNRGDLTSEKLQEVLERALQLALASPI